jgi:acyl-CoA synthetase (AMP-forming)/AMP-acid ligase II
MPKAIMHTNNTVSHSARTLQRTFGFSADDVCLQYVPMSTNYGAIMGLYLPALTGAGLVLLDRFSATRAVELIDEENVTFVAGTPTGFISMTHSRAVERGRFESLRLLMSAGSAFPVAAIAELRETFDTTFIDSFGMNEFGMGLWCSVDDDPPQVDGSIGRPMSGVEARVVDNNGDDCAGGDIGELVIKSAGMCCGYHDHPEANDASWDADGWFYSGDLATLDQDKLFRIVGRSKDVIIRGGANVSPREVEEVLMHHPAIREASVIGLADAYYGEIVCACVIPAAGTSPEKDDVLEFLSDRLARYKLPARIVVFEQFPLNSMGKVQKQALRDLVVAQDPHGSP